MIAMPEHRCHLVEPICVESQGSPIDPLQPIDQRMASDEACCQRIGGEFLASRYSMGRAKKRFSVPEERFLEKRTVLREPLQRATNGSSCLVNPRPQLRIAAMEMAELVREHSAELRDAQHFE